MNSTTSTNSTNSTTSTTSTDSTVTSIKSLPIRRSGRKSNPPKKFTDEKFIPGSNNGYTAGREIDTWDKNY